MIPEIDNLVIDVLQATGADPPGLLSEDSPALSIAEDDALYFVGLIGGKDVGKSSLVNALVGLPISQVTSHGPGTEIVVAYAHASAVEAVRARLEPEVPGRLRVVSHDSAALARQVLLDLPDIDSVYADHLEVTRRMLRHMLFPIWIQSIEKYADQQPQKWLSRVAEGNDPGNFLFALNKVDLLHSHDGESAVTELCEDFSRRIARTLSLRQPPKVYAIAAAAPHRFDLPALRQALSRPRDEDELAASRDLAARQRARTLLSWLRAQQLDERARRLGRLTDEAGQVVTDRLLMPLLGTSIPRLLNDPAYRSGLIEPAVARRLRRWPIVGAINAVLSPAIAFLSRTVSGRLGEAPAVATVVQPEQARQIATAFAHVERMHPEVPKLYAHRKLWEEPVALHAAGELRDRLTVASDGQHQAILDRAGGRSLGAVGAAWRWLLTVGAIIWFPFVQPVAGIVLADGVSGTAREIARVVVGVLGASHLLQSGAFLILWFMLLWMLLRFGAQRRAEAMIERWKTDDGLDPHLSFAAQAIEWTQDLLAPLRQQQARFDELAAREARLRERFELRREAA